MEQSTILVGRAYGCYIYNSTFMSCQAVMRENWGCMVLG